MDLHEDIHRAVDNYLDANEFRRFLNAALQNSRGVSFLVQKRKAKWADFDDWYTNWQDEAKSNAVMGWGVASRNRIVKEEDLNTFSQAILSFYGERLQVAEATYKVPARITVDEILSLFADEIEQNPPSEDSWIRVQRRWVDDQLPEHEIVSALRELYAGVCALISRAHEASDVSACNAPAFSRACVTAELDPHLTCLGVGDPLPSAVIDARAGEVIQAEYGVITHDEESIARGRARYGLIPKRGQTALEHAEGRMELSKRFLEADGSVVTMLLLFRGNEEMRVSPAMFPRGYPRELVIATAVSAHGAWPYDGAVFASEMWISEPGNLVGRGGIVGVSPEDLLPVDEDVYDADPVGDREEALIVQAVQKDGRSRVLVQPFARTRNGIVYGKLTDDDSGEWITPFLRPVWRHWPKWRSWRPGPLRPYETGDGGPAGH
jgi:hypothetical protein